MTTSNFVETVMMIKIEDFTYTHAVVKTNFFENFILVKISRTLKTKFYTVYKPKFF